MQATMHLATQILELPVERIEPTRLPLFLRGLSHLLQFTLEAVAQRLDQWFARQARQFMGQCCIFAIETECHATIPLSNIGELSASNSQASFGPSQSNSLSKPPKG